MRITAAASAEIPSSSSSLTVDTGASDDKITIDVRANAGDIYVNTGVGADTVTVTSPKEPIYASAARKVGTASIPLR